MSIGSIVAMLSLWVIAAGIMFGAPGVWMLAFTVAAIFAVIIMG